MLSQLQSFSNWMNLSLSAQDRVTHGLRRHHQSQALAAFTLAPEDEQRLRRPVTDPFIARHETGDLPRPAVDSLADIRCECPEGSPNDRLYTAIENRNPWRMREAINDGASVNAVLNEHCDTPLHVLASLSSFSDSIQRLLGTRDRCGELADLTRRNFDGDTPLHVAVRMGNAKFLKEVAYMVGQDPTRAIDFDVCNKDGLRAIDLARYDRQVLSAFRALMQAAGVN